MDFPYDGKSSKTHRMGQPGKLVPILLPQYELFSQLDSHPAVYFTIWEMHGFSRQFFIAQKNNIVWGRFWEISTHTFFSHQIPILWYTSSLGKWMGFPINFPQHRKMIQNPSNWKILENWYPYFPQSMSTFLPLDSYPMVYFTIWEMHDCSHQFPIAQGTAVKSTQ